MTSTKPHTLEITYRRLSELRPFEGNARRHSRKQLAQISASIQKFGFTNPILIADDDQMLAGHGRLEAAKLLGMSDIPTVRLSQMTEVDRRAYVIADNKLALNAGWDSEVLAGEMQALIEIGFLADLGWFLFASCVLVVLMTELGNGFPGRKGRNAYMRAQTPASLRSGACSVTPDGIPLSHFSMAGYYDCRPVPGTNGPRSNLQGGRDTVQEAADAREWPNIIRRSRGSTRVVRARPAVSSLFKRKDVPRLGASFTGTERAPMHLLARF